MSHEHGSPPSGDDSFSPVLDPVEEAAHYQAARRSPSEGGAAVESSACLTGDAPARLDTFDAELLASALRNASHSHGGSQLDFKLPWELGGMELIFGSRELLPKLQASALLPMPVSLEAADSTVSRAAKRVKVVPADQLFRKAVNFKLRESDEQKEDRCWERAIERWLVIIAETPSASLIGATLPLRDVQQSMAVVRELFGKKAVGTVLKRANDLLKFFTWCRETHPFRSPIPFEGAIVDEYLRHLRDTGKRVGALRGFAEAINFSLHVVGLSATLDRPVWSPWAKGLLSFMDLQRPSKLSKTALTVAMVKWLEEFLVSEDNGICDRYAAGTCLFAIFSRSRNSDLKVCENWDLDFEDIRTSGKGFVECTTRNHKTSKQMAQQAIPMPLVAPAVGLGPIAWGPVWARVAGECGLPFPRGKGPVLPAPTVDGGWMNRAVTSEELSAWLRSILEKGGFDVSNISSHSLKHTTLQWAAKWGMDKYIRTLLGHHSTGGKSLDTYARDVLAPALLEYEEMLRQVRIGSFAPDVSRSGRFVKPSKDAEANFGHPVVPEPADTRLAGSSEPGGVVEASDHPGATSALDVGPYQDLPEGSDWDDHGPEEVRVMEPNNISADAPKPDNDGEGSDSSSSSSSSEEEESDEPEREVAERAQNFGEQGRVAPLSPAFDFFEHKRTMTVHVRTSGSAAATFNCGRKISDDYRPTSHAVFPDLRMCKQCRSNKPLRDVGGLLAAVEAARSSR